jgi:hypothetical protein
MVTINIIMYEETPADSNGRAGKAWAACGSPLAGTAGSNSPSRVSVVRCQVEVSALG